MHRRGAATRFPSYPVTLMRIASSEFHFMSFDMLLWNLSLANCGRGDYYSPAACVNVSVYLLPGGGTFLAKK